MYLVLVYLMWIDINSNPATFIAHRKIGPAAKNNFLGEIRVYFQLLQNPISKRAALFVVF